MISADQRFGRRQAAESALGAGTGWAYLLVRNRAVSSVPQPESRKNRTSARKRRSEEETSRSPRSKEAPSQRRPWTWPSDVVRRAVQNGTELGRLGQSPWWKRWGDSQGGSGAVRGSMKRASQAAIFTMSRFLCSVFFARPRPRYWRWIARSLLIHKAKTTSICEFF